VLFGSCERKEEKTLGLVFLLIIIMIQGFRRSFLGFWLTIYFFFSRGALLSERVGRDKLRAANDLGHMDGLSIGRYIKSNWL
jgi:hypothetical protein